MLGRIFLAGAAVLALGAPSTLAGPVHGPFWPLALACFHSQAQSTQCAIQVVKGNRNKARTDQTTEQPGFQFALTSQKGDDNRSYIGQDGTDQVAKSIQVGDGNASFTYQQGEDQFSKTVQIGDGHWAGTSSIGEDTSTSVFQSN